MENLSGLAHYCPHISAARSRSAVLTRRVTRDVCARKLGERSGHWRARKRRTCLDLKSKGRLAGANKRDELTKEIAKCDAALEMTNEEDLGFLDRVIKAVPHHTFDFGQRAYCGIGGVVITKAPCAVSH